MTDRDRRDESCPGRVLLSDSFDRKQRFIRESVLTQHGHYESVLELGGKVVGPNIIVTEGLIPKAVIGYAHFRVEDRDLSACWARADKDMSPVGDLHYHPEAGFNGRGPSASSTDEENSLRQSGLYHVFNLQRYLDRKVLEKSPGVQPGKHHYYDIDPFMSLSIPARKGEAPGEPLILTLREERALWASLIAPRDGDCANLTASVVEHVYSSKHPKEPAVLVHADVPAEILSDEEIAQILGWPIEKVRLEINPEELEREVAEKYRTGGYGEYRYGAKEYRSRDCGGYPKWSWKTWKKEYRDSPVWYRPSWWQKPGESPYLDSSSTSRDVARVLRDVASRVAGKPSEENENERSSFLGKDGGKSEILRALSECYWFLRDRVERGVHDAH